MSIIPTVLEISARGERAFDIYSPEDALTYGLIDEIILPRRGVAAPSEVEMAG